MAGFSRNLVLLELFPIVLVVELWGKYFCNKRVHFNCDDLVVVVAINSILSSSTLVVRMLHHLVLSCLHLNTFVYDVYVTLSQFQWDKLHMLASGAELLVRNGCGGLLWID